MKRNYENKWSNETRKDRYGYCRIMLNYDGYGMPVLAKPLKPSKLVLEDIAESKRINLTTWKFKVDPELKSNKKFAKIQGTADLYYNGAEGCWKFYDDNPFNVNLTNKDLRMLDDIDPFTSYMPHYDDHKCYGDESVHAVYDL